MGARVAAMAVLVLAALLLKTIVLPTFAVAGFRPDVLVVVLVGVGLMEGPDTGLRMGFLAGLAQDLVSGGDALVGLWALVLMAVGWVAGQARPYIATSQRVGAILLCGVLSAVATLGYGVLGRLFAVVGVTWGQVLFGALVVGLYSCLIAPLVLRPTRSVMRQFPAQAR